MAPEDRRAALVAATVPLVRSHGLDVSTKQIAQAAGVAEGTIFGVFPDKNSLLVAALLHALDPRPTLDAMAAIDPALDLRARLTEAVGLVHDRFADNAHLMSAARSAMVTGCGGAETHRRMAESRERLLTALTAVIEPDAALLRTSAATTARLLLLFCGGNTYGPFGDPERFKSVEIVSLLLDGLLIVTAGDDPSIVPLLRKPGVP
jgi:AcrR family transcriptional regulator